MHRAVQLFELLPEGPAQLLPADAMYVHIPGFDWWYVVMVIAYFIHYLLAIHLSPSHDTRALTTGIYQIRSEAERLNERLEPTTTLVPDTGSNFLAQRFPSHIQDALRQMRMRYRTLQQLWPLERFRQSLEQQEVNEDRHCSPGEAPDLHAPFRQRHNESRPHWGLVFESGGDPLTSEEAYRQAIPIHLPAWQGWAKITREKIGVIPVVGDECKAV